MSEKGPAALGMPQNNSQFPDLADPPSKKENLLRRIQRRKKNCLSQRMRFRDPLNHHQMRKDQNQRNPPWSGYVRKGE